MPSQVFRIFYAKLITWINRKKINLCGYCTTLSPNDSNLDMSAILWKCKTPWFFESFIGDDGLPFAEHISIHVHQAVTLFSYLVYIEDSSKGSAKEASFMHIYKIMQCAQRCFPMQCSYVTITEVVPEI